MSENAVPIKKNMLNMSLFSIIFIIFYYLINKINKKYDCFADVSSNPDINAAIVNAVNNKYKADVEAIRNLSSIAHALHTTNNLNVPGNLKVNGQVNTMGKTNYPPGWDGGVRTIDVYASGNIGMGDENGICKTFINSSGVNTNKVLVKSTDGRECTITDGTDFGIDSGNSLCILGKGADKKIYLGDNVSVSGTHTVGSTSYLNKIQIGVSDGTANTITDAYHDASALCIVGKAGSSGRSVHLWDDVIIDRNLNVKGNTTVNSHLYLNTNSGTTSLNSYGPQHWVGDNFLALRFKDGVKIDKEWGGNGNLTVAGTATVNALQARNNNGGIDDTGHVYGTIISTNGTLYVGGLMTVNSNSIINYDATIKQDLFVNRNARVDGNTQINGQLSLNTGSSSGNGFIIGGNNNSWVFNNYYNDTKLGLRRATSATTWSDTLFSVDNTGAATVSRLKIGDWEIYQDGDTLQFRNIKISPYTTTSKAGLYAMAPDQGDCHGTDAIWICKS